MPNLHTLQNTETKRNEAILQQKILADVTECAA